MPSSSKESLREKYKALYKKLDKLRSIPLDELTILELVEEAKFTLELANAKTELMK